MVRRTRDGQADAGATMTWRWWREWRERRSALAEVERLSRHDEAVVMDQDANPLHLAKQAIDRHDVEAAAAFWKRARLMTPTAVLTSPDSLEVLIGLKRYDEADALMRERAKRFPRDRTYLIGLARSAEERGDLEEAVKRWAVVRDRVEDTILGHHGCGRCLMAMNRMDEAEVQWDAAIRRIADNPEAFMRRANISDFRKDWAESERRWKYVAETFDFAPAFAFRARSLIQLGRIDEAEAYLSGPASAYPGDLDIAITRSHLAQRLGDIAAACDRWLRVRAIRPDFRAGHEEGARRLFEAGRHADADEVLRAAIERFPDQSWPLINYARHAHDRQDWPEAAARWAMVRDRFPEESDGYGFAAQALRAMGREAEAAALTATR